MEVTKEGVVYRLKNRGDDTTQQVVFTHRTDDGNFVNGTTNEEVLSMLIERMYTLQKNKYSSENQTAIILLKNVRRLLAKRVAKKKQRSEYHGYEFKDTS